MLMSFYHQMCVRTIFDLMYHLFRTIYSPEGTKSTAQFVTSGTRALRKRSSFPLAEAAALGRMTGLTTCFQVAYAAYSSEKRSTPDTSWLMGRSLPLHLPEAGKQADMHAEQAWRSSPHKVPLEIQRKSLWILRIN
jgi:hypothetical protein